MNDGVYSLLVEDGASSDDVVRVSKTSPAFAREGVRGVSRPELGRVGSCEGVIYC